MSDLICVGSISGSYGVKGELRVKSFCAQPSDLEKYNPLLTEDGKQSFELSLIGQIKNGFSARILGINSKEEADLLRGVSLFARRDSLPPLSTDEFYYTDLINMEVPQMEQTLSSHLKNPILQLGTGLNGLLLLLGSNLETDMQYFLQHQHIKGSVQGPENSWSPL